MHAFRSTPFVVLFMLAGCSKAVESKGAPGGLDDAKKDDAKKDVARVEIEAVAKAAQAYYVRHAEVPASLDALRAEEYLKPKQLVDPWERPYHFEAASVNAIHVCSGGPDQQLGTDDDVCGPKATGDAKTIHGQPDLARPSRDSGR